MRETPRAPAQSDGSPDTNGSFAGKRAHRLWTARTSRDFEELFDREFGLSVTDVVARFVSPDQIRLVVLGGSIALAMASPVSDIDLILVVDKASAVPHTPPAADAKVVFRAHREALILAECMAMVSGLEVDVQVVARERVGELLERVSKGQAAFAHEELVVLSRLATGWPLSGDGSQVFERWRSPWRQSLRVFCTTRDYLFALKAFEDAVEEARRLPELALHLGRLAAEFGYRSYFSSKGYAALGSKWMMLLSAGHAFHARHIAGTAIAAPAAQAALLFPDGERAATSATDYLRRVAEFLTMVRAEIEKDQSMKIALRLCRQVYPLAHAGAARHLGG